MVRNSSIRSSLISASTIIENGFSDILTVLVKALVATEGVLVTRKVALLILKAFEDRRKKRQEVESSFIMSCQLSETASKRLPKGEMLYWNEKFPESLLNF
jgi:hypothetical protein